MQRFRGGLVFKAHRLFYHSTLGLRVIKKKRRVEGRNLIGVAPEPRGLAVSWQARANGWTALAGKGWREGDPGWCTGPLQGPSLQPSRRQGRNLFGVAPEPVGLGVCLLPHPRLFVRFHGYLSQQRFHFCFETFHSRRLSRWAAREAKGMGV